MTAPPSARRARAVLSDLAQAHRLRPVERGVDGGQRPLRPGPLWDQDSQAFPVTDLGTSRPFATVVAERRSTRALAPPTLAQVGLVVARSGLTRASAQDSAGMPIAHRPAPSAGARHPLSLVVLAGNVIGLSSGGWILDADGAALRRARYSQRTTESAMEQIAEALRLTEPPPAAVVAVAHPEAAISRYPDGMSLLWRETGALLMLVHLAATDLGLGSCIVGTCGVLHPVSANPDDYVDVGAVALGGTTAATGVERDGVAR